MDADDVALAREEEHLGLLYFCMHHHRNEARICEAQEAFLSAANHRKSAHAAEVRAIPIAHRVECMKARIRDKAALAVDVSVAGAVAGADRLGG